jgi:phage terminase large subunit-like protein
VKKFHKTIEDEQTGSIYKALASDSHAAHGLAASMVACDELAQWKRRDFFDVLRTSMGKREEPLMAIISTQSPRPENVMSELVDYTKRIESGEFEDSTFYGAVYEAHEDADIDDEQAWYDANPALGVFRSYDELVQECKLAQRLPANEPAFRNLYLNQRVDAEPKAINPKEWEMCGTEYSEDDLYGPCYAGLDLSSTRDLTSLVLYFPESGAVVPYFWCPESGLAEKAEVDGVPYQTWAKQGYIEPTPGKGIDKFAIARRCAEIKELYRVTGMAYDRWSMADLQKILDHEGIDLPLESWGQGFASMSPAINAFEAELLNGNLKHANNPVLRWCASNAVFNTDPSGNRKLDKDKSTDRIDGLVALVMACGLAAKMQEKGEISVDFVFI